MNNWATACILGVVFSTVLGGRAAGQCEAKASEMVAALQRHYEHTSSWQAEFKQETEFVALGRRERARGEVSFKKPGRMRWEYEGGDERLIVSDGDNLWFYEPADQQVVKVKLTAAFSSATPYAFLTGVGQLGRDFDAKLLTGQCTEAQARLSLKAKEGQGGAEAVLTIDRQRFEVKAIETTDAVGNVTRITFTSIKSPRELPDRLFRFEPPPGIDIVVPPGQMGGE